LLSILMQRYGGWKYPVSPIFVMRTSPIFVMQNRSDITNIGDAEARRHHQFL